MRPHQLHEIVVGDEPSAWEAAGFAVERDTVTIDNTRIRLVGQLDGRGIRSIALDDMAAADLDGVTVHAADPADDAALHPNGVTHIDHLVVMTEDCDRTTASLEAAGLESRRVRRFEMGGVMRRQTFFWLGDVILELVGADEPQGSSPAQAWGLALTSSDIDQTAEVLDGRCSPPKDAVQPGRRITTIATKALDISTALAVMSPHPDTDS